MTDRQARARLASVTQEVAKLDLVKRFGAIREKTQAVLDLARQLYGVDIQPHVSFNLRGRAAGFREERPSPRSFPP